MLPKLFTQIDKNADCIIKKFVGDRDVSIFGAFACGSVISFEVSVSRMLGARGLVMRICRDGMGDYKMKMARLVRLRQQAVNVLRTGRFPQ